MSGRNPHLNMCFLMKEKKMQNFLKRICIRKDLIKVILIFSLKIIRVLDHSESINMQCKSRKKNGVHNKPIFAVRVEGGQKVRNYQVFFTPSLSVTFAGCSFINRSTYIHIVYFEYEYGAKFRILLDLFVSYCACIIHYRLPL